MQAELDRLQSQENLDSKYDKITVWPQSMAMIVDWVNGNIAKLPPNVKPRSDSFRAKSVAPTNGFNANNFDQRATSAPPATPKPFPPRR